MTRDRGPELWSWLGDHLALDFANTVKVVHDERVELLATTSDLQQWLRVVPHELGAVTYVDESLRTQLVELRDAALEVLHAAHDGRHLPATATAQVNAAVVAASTCRQLTTQSRTSTYAPAPGLNQSDALIGRLAAAVVDLVARDDLANLAVCPAPLCGQFFHRARPNQRWCSAGCGNRARVDRLRHRATAR
jgi:predicted RNA-binding Zn ribbon-like protein